MAIANPMQSNEKIESAAKNNQAQENRINDLSYPQWMPRGLFKAIGPISLFVLVVAVAVGFYAHEHVTKDSVRFQFWVGFMFSFLAFVVLLVQSVIYAQQAEFMREQSRAMRESVERTDTIIEKMEEQLVAMRDEASAALRQLEITDRPWLAVEVQIVGPLAFNEQGASITFRIATKNVGRSVAVNATVHAKVVVPVLGGNVWDAVLTEQLSVCKNIDTRFMSYAIFPDSAFVSDRDFGIGPEQLERGRLMETDFFSIYLVGCADYQFSGHNAHHQTRFAYEVHRIDVDHPHFRLGLSIGQGVPVERLILDKLIIGPGDYAD